MDKSTQVGRNTSINKGNVPKAAAMVRAYIVSGVWYLCTIAEKGPAGKWGTTIPKLLNWVAHSNQNAKLPEGNLP